MLDSQATELLTEVRKIRELLEQLVGQTGATNIAPVKAKPKQIDIMVGAFEYKAQDDSIWKYKYCLKGMKIPYKFKEDFKGKSAELSPDHVEGQKYNLGYMWERNDKTWTIFSDDQELIKTLAEYVVTDLEGEI